MDAGRELDLIIASKIFGIKKIHYGKWDTEKKFPQYIPSGKPWRTHQIDAKPVPAFSTHIAHAWEIVEKLRRDGWNISISADNGWGCTFYKVNVQGDEQFNATWEESHGPINSDTTPLAICRAALLTLETSHALRHEHRTRSQRRALCPCGCEPVRGGVRAV